MSNILLDETAPDETQEDGSKPPPKGPTVFQAVSDALDADLFIFSGGTSRRLAGLFINEVAKAGKRENAALVLCTNGGDPDAAYIIARILKTEYKKFILFVFGWCKSAGTIIALGADEIVMSKQGELGPLDVQMLKTDELFFRSSGLDISQAIESLSERASDVFWDTFINVLYRSNGVISTKTAADIASTLAVGLLSPITAQIDPFRLGEVERAINIAKDYGERLNGDSKKVEKLIRGYPSHSFVIDYTEACSLFGNVRQPNEVEQALEHYLRNLETAKGFQCISSPNEKGMVGYIEAPSEAENEQQNAAEDAEPQHTDADGHESANGNNPRQQETVASGDAPDVQTTEANASGHSTDGQGQRSGV